MEAESVRLRALGRLPGEDRLRAALEMSELVSRIHDAGVVAREWAVPSTQEPPPALLDEDVASQE